MPYVSRAQDLELGREVLKLADKPTSFTGLFRELYVSPERATRVLAALEGEGLIGRVVIGGRIYWQTTEKGRLMDK